MNLRFHSDPSAIYDQSGNLYPEPKETLEDLETKLNDASEKLKAFQKPKSASEYTDDDDDIFFDFGMARFNLCSYIENLEWKVDLKLFYAKSCFSD
jgi:hypothetical protein